MMSGDDHWKDAIDLFVEGQVELDKKIPSSPILSLYDFIKESRKEAVRRNIQANAIIINDRLYYSEYHEQGSFQRFPMICGLKAFYTDELPNDTRYALIEATCIPDSKDERIEKLEKENAELREKVGLIERVLNGGAKE